MSGRGYDAGYPPPPPKPRDWQPIHARSAAVTPEAPTPPGRSAEAIAAVSAMVEKFMSERPWKQPGFVSGADAPVRPRHLAPEHLAMAYDRLAASGNRAAKTRMAMLTGRE